MKKLIEKSKNGKLIFFHFLLKNKISAIFFRLFSAFFRLLKMRKIMDDKTI